MPDDPKEPPSHVVEQLLSKSWSEVEALEHAGYLLFPSELRRRQKDGTYKAQPIMLRVPRQHEVRAARVRARAMAAEDGLDQELDKDLVSDLENFCLLSIAIRNTTHPHEPYEPDVRLLEKNWDRASLVQAWNNLDSLYRVVDPAPSEISEPEMLMLMAKLAKEQNLGPLAVYGPAARESFIVFMASRLLSFLASK